MTDAFMPTYGSPNTVRFFADAFENAGILNPEDRIAAERFFGLGGLFPNNGYTDVMPISDSLRAMNHTSALIKKYVEDGTLLETFTYPKSSHLEIPSGFLMIDALERQGVNISDLLMFGYSGHTTRAGEAILHSNPVFPKQPTEAHTPIVLSLANLGEVMAQRDDSMLYVLPGYSDEKYGLTIVTGGVLQQDVKEGVVDGIPVDLYRLKDHNLSGGLGGVASGIEPAA